MLASLMHTPPGDVVIADFMYEPCLQTQKQITVHGRWAGLHWGDVIQREVKYLEQKQNIKWHPERDTNWRRSWKGNSRMAQFSLLYKFQKTNNYLGYYPTEASLISSDLSSVLEQISAWVNIYHLNRDVT